MGEIFPRYLPSRQRYSYDYLDALVKLTLVDDGHGSHDDRGDVSVAPLGTGLLATRNWKTRL